MERKEFKNQEGYADTTAYEALQNIEVEKRFKELLRVLFWCLNHSGFELVGRFHIRDKRTGREFE